MNALLLALLLAPTASAGELAGRTAGVHVDIAGGLGVGDLPFTAGPGWTLALGGWWGKGDAAGAIGRRTEVSLRWQGALNARELRNYPGLEIQRAIDLLVLGIRFGGFVAPRLRSATSEPAFACKDPCPAIVTAPPVAPDLVVDGLTLRAHGALVWRFRPPVGLLLRLDAGLDIDARSATDQVVEPVVGLLLGFEVTPVVGKAR